MLRYLFRICLLICCPFSLIGCSDQELSSLTENNFTSTTKTRSINESLYYYYQGQKVYLHINTNAYFVSRKSQNPNDEYNYIMTYSPNHISPLSTETTQNANEQSVLFFKKEYIKQRSISTENYLEYLNTLVTEDDDINFISPCFENNTNENYYCSPYIYVKVKELADTVMLKDMCTQYSVQYQGQLSGMKSWYVLRCMKAGVDNAIKVANILYENGQFEYSTPAFSDLEPHTGAYYNLQWGLNNTGLYNGKSGIDIRYELAMSLIGTSIHPVLIGIVDTGIDYSHESIYTHSVSYDAKNDAVLSGRSVVYSNSNNPAGHGTCCAGIIAGIGETYGISPNYGGCAVSISVLFGSSTTTEETARGITWAKNNNISIINCSWGSALGNDLLTDAIDDAVKNGRGGKGCIVVVSTGNSNSSYIYFPSSLDNVISVGAIDMFGKRKSPSCLYENYWGSNYGNGLDVVAPGIRIATTDISDNGGFNPNLPISKEITDVSNLDYTNQFNGTSAAAPFVSGVAAMLLCKNPNLTQEEVRSIIQTTCTKLPDYNYTNLYTDGSWNNEVGYGLINAYEAISKVVIGEEDLTIEGSNPITNEYKTFIVRNVPSGCFVEWSVSSSDFIVSRNGYNSAMIKANASGQSATLFAKVKKGSLVLYNLSKEIYSLY